MDFARTLEARCEAVGLNPADRSVAETIRVAPGAFGPGALPTLRSERQAERSARELPKISVELRGTLSGDRAGADEATPSARERDLQVLRTLGEGGMGRVFLARQHSLDREVAIKTVKDSASASERDALLAEGAVVGHLEHPGVVPVHALGIDEDGRPVLVMKRVEGAPWSELLADRDHPAWTYLGASAGDRLEGHLAILSQVCSAVDFAHSRGILHRDIKPSNVLIGRYGEVYLADWGLALRLDEGGVVQPLCGTPSFMAPEMVTGGKVDERTDVYLLGATLHEILTGRSRHAGETVREVLLAATASTPFSYARSVPEALAAVANAATSARPEDRPAHANEVRQALMDYLRHRSSIALAGSATERLARLEALLADKEGLARESLQREVDRLGAEAGFALEQALAEWKDNPVAVRGAARLEAMLGSKRTRAAQLERLARDLDLGVSSRQRAFAVAGLALVGMALSITGFLVDGTTVTVRALLLQSLVPLSVAIVGAGVLRRHLLGTVVNRRMATWLILALASISAHRAVALQMGVPAPQVLAFDCLDLGVWCALASGLFFRWLGWCSGLGLAAAVVATAWPERAMTAFSAATGLGLILCVYFNSKFAQTSRR